MLLITSCYVTIPSFTEVWKDVLLHAVQSSTKSNWNSNKIGQHTFKDEVNSQDWLRHVYKLYFLNNGHQP